MGMKAATKSYAVLYGFNALVVLAMASFFFIMSEKIVRTYQARDFLERVPVLPMAASEELFLLLLLFALRYSDYRVTFSCFIDKNV